MQPGGGGKQGQGSQAGRGRLRHGQPWVEVDKRGKAVAKKWRLRCQPRCRPPVPYKKEHGEWGNQRQKGLLEGGCL